MAKKIDNEKLKSFVRNDAARLLDDSNITSVGVAYKLTDGKRSNELSIQFTVGEKVGLESIETLGSEAIPEFFTVDGVDIPTDVVQRKYLPSAQIVEDLEKVDRKRKMNPVRPGASIGHPDISAGTAGCVVFDAESGEEYMLSNWHVLSGEFGQTGDLIVQPGKHDDHRIDQNIAGELVNSHLGLAGDCAIARIDRRELDDVIIDLDTSVKQIADPELDDRVIKSGRTTAVTRGIVSRVFVTVKLNYGGSLGLQRIGGFEYVPDPDFPPANGEVSMGGDSGSVVLLIKNNKPTTVMMGLHFAGEVGDAREHGLACYASSVFKKLGIVPGKKDMRDSEKTPEGFNVDFLSHTISAPEPSTKAVERGLLTVNGKKVIDYTHFSLAMNRRRKFAAWVAWNIDGGSIKLVDTDGVSFRKDKEFEDGQIGNELYKFNPLDRGHIARRAALCWGPIEEARKANKDSFFYSNIAPQHERFNRSNKSGIWGELENAVFAGAKVEDLKISVMGGPIFDDDKDPVHRGVKIPREFWKIICYVDPSTDTLESHAFVLTQSELITDLEVLRSLEGIDLDEFEIFKVPVQHISQKTGFDFPELIGLQTEALKTAPALRIQSLDMVLQ